LEGSLWGWKGERSRAVGMKIGGERPVWRKKNERTSEKDMGEGEGGGERV